MSTNYPYDILYVAHDNANEGQTQSARALTGYAVWTKGFKKLTPRETGIKALGRWLAANVPADVPVIWEPSWTKAVSDQPGCDPIKHRKVSVRRAIYEAAYGSDLDVNNVARTHRLIFADGNERNVNPANIVLVKR